MKKLFLILAVFSISQGALAKFSCTFSKWSPGIGSTYYASGIPKKIVMKKDQQIGYIEGHEVAKIETLDARYEYVLNGRAQCSEQNDCQLIGKITEIYVSKTGGPFGFTGFYHISVNSGEETAIELEGKRALKIKCN